MGNNKNLTCHVFKYKHMKWSHWCITASLDYKNTMINRITMETVACLRSKCHLKQNLIPSWPWSFWHTSCISDAKQNTQKKFLSDTRTGILGSIAGSCDFLPARFDEFQKVCRWYVINYCWDQIHIKFQLNRFFIENIC